MEEHSRVDAIRKVDERDSANARLPRNLRHRLMQDIMQVNAGMEDNRQKRKADEMGSDAEVENSFEDGNAMIEDTVVEGGDIKDVFN